jgi:KDO2-lipid IV(A) lauroyltransferase
VADGQPWRRRLRYALEAAALYVGYGLFRLLPLTLASAIGGRLGRSVGPYLPASATARRNLAMAFPEKTAAEIDAIVRGMWDNLGRVAAEYPHVRRLRIYEPGSPVEVIGAEILDRLREDGAPAVMISGHIANWEVMRIALAQRRLAMTAAYRRANNPWVDRLIFQGREDEFTRLVPKGAAGARSLLAAAKEGRHLVVLVDQKMNDGLAVPFFGRPAMTAPAPVDIARRFGCPLVPVRIERLQGFRFRITVQEPVELAVSEDRHADLRVGIERINHLLEDWIRERPEQWLWVHRRWD